MQQLSVVAHVSVVVEMVYRVVVERLVTTRCCTDQTKRHSCVAPDQVYWVFSRKHVLWC